MTKRKKNKPPEEDLLPFYPQKVTDIFLAFPADVSHLMPEWEEIPDWAKTFNLNNEWVAATTGWFYYGLADGVEVEQSRKDVHPEMAFRHVRAILGSYQPKHEHKIAAVAYLMSLWFKKPPKTKDSAG